MTTNAEKRWGVLLRGPQGPRWCCLEMGPADSDVPWQSTRERADEVCAELSARFPSATYEVLPYDATLTRD